MRVLTIVANSRGKSFVVEEATTRRAIRLEQRDGTAKSLHF